MHSNTFQLSNGSELFIEQISLGLRPDPDYTVSSWADDKRILSSKSAAEPGRWRTERTPYLREIMDCLSPQHHCEKVVAQMGAQTGKTESGNNWMGYIVDISPGPLLMVQPTVELAKRLSKQRISSMIEETPSLRDKIADSRSRDSGNTMLMKEFPGGVMILTGANSAVGLRSMPIRFLFCDEVDGYPQDVEGEGDPVSLAEKRTTTFARRKIFLTSTPTIRDTSRIEQEFENSDMRYYYVPCPHCEVKQRLVWGQIKYKDDDPLSAEYECERCGERIPERFKTWMLKNGEWRATKIVDGEIVEVDKDPEAKIVGFHLSSLYSPLGWKSWASIVEEFISARKSRDPAKLKTWINTVLAETWDDMQGERIAGETLRARAEPYRFWEAPEGVLLVTAGVDVQDNRLAVVVDGWGEGEENWTLFWGEIFGDTEKEEVWGKLDEILHRKIKHQYGGELRIAAMAIDAGYRSNTVYKFCRMRSDLHVFPVRGSRSTMLLGRPSSQEVDYNGAIIKNGIQLWPVGDDAIKSTLYARWRLQTPGYNYSHFSTDLPQDFYEQLTSEILVTRFVKGFPVKEWVKRDSTRNEAIDCKKYSYAAALYAGITRIDWDEVRKTIIPPEFLGVELADSPASSALPVAPPLPPSRGGWIPKQKGWLQRR